MLSETGRKLLAVLVDVAKKGETITYTELARRCGQNTDDQYRINWTFKPLGNISRYTYDELGIFISVLVTNKDSGPGPGFLQMAGLNILNDVEGLTASKNFVKAHLKTVHSIDPKKLDLLLVC